MKKLKANLEAHIKELSENIGMRNYLHYDELNKAIDYIIVEFEKSGYKPKTQNYDIKGKTYKNIIAVKEGNKRSREVIVVGAHYDSIVGSPGANDNGSGVSAVLELSRLLSGISTNRTVKFIAFANEEPPFFFSKHMGSRVYAKDAKRRKEDIRAMICLETIGYYSEKRNSQKYPPFYKHFYPDRANFIGTIGNFKSRRLVKIIDKVFKKNPTINMLTAVAPEFIPGVSFSDHDSFWRHGYRACMVTDTAFYRYPHYHTLEDTYEKLDYGKLSHVVGGIYQAIIRMSKSRLI